jgi:hypothetical protein
MRNKSARLDEIFLKAQQELTAEEKAELINRFLRGSGLSVVFSEQRNNQPSSSLIGQINMTSSEQLPDLLDAVVARIRNTST